MNVEDVKRIASVMARQAALGKLREIAERPKPSDYEVDHRQADAVLLALIDDPDITEAYGAIRKMYA